MCFGEGLQKYICSKVWQVRGIMAVISKFMLLKVQNL